MNPNCRYDSADEPLWLIVQQDDQTRCFVFPSSEGKAIVIGSCSTADVRIRTGAPIVFFLERESQSILLTPAYPEADLRLNARKVEGECRIYTQGLVELGNVQLRLKVRDTPPTLRGEGFVTPSADDFEPIPDPVARIVDHLATTTTIDTSVVGASLWNAAPRISSGQAMPAVALLAEPIEDPVLPNFDEWFDQAVFGIPATHRCSHATLYARTLKVTPVSWPPEALERAQALPSENRNSPTETVEDRRAVLEKLGLLTMRRPWLVLTAAAAGSFLLVVLAVGVERFVGHERTRSSVRQPATRAPNRHSQNPSREAAAAMQPSPIATMAKQVSHKIDSGRYHGL